ncbi:MAG: DUF1848 family protein [Methanobrevibacter sp.]|uniref:DUF1848 domain-containing protein n=1 Tax=Methanobrevibacter sp. TaxID=66852 RepID=UPI0025E0E051|nr:DUF1848 family protein [Methanobrevibacter sp.]MBQ6098537.1 DUF1848 family protein [Methanobrevibacter sp.]
MIINTGSRTDIPAFFSKWLFNRIDEGFVCTRNPYNDDIYKYPLDSKIIDCLCFCTKNPKPMLKNIDLLDDYNQFWFVTITPYENDIEANVPNFKKVLKSFKELSDYLGVNKISWRYDPIFITEKYSLDYHIDKFEQIASEISDYTNDCTISFIDLYRKVLRNFPEVCEVTTDERLIIGENFSKIAKEYGIRMKTCVEGTLLDQFGFDSSGCMTQQVIEKAIGNNLKIPKGKYRIRECDCIFGRDIGAYNTCLHGCKYCYANFSTKLVKRNWKLHNPDSPLLIGNVKDSDVVKEISEPSYIDAQTRLF